MLVVTRVELIVGAVTSCSFISKTRLMVPGELDAFVVLVAPRTIGGVVSELVVPPPPPLSPAPPPVVEEGDRPILPPPQPAIRAVARMTMKTPVTHCRCPTHPSFSAKRSANKHIAN